MSKLKNNLDKNLNNKKVYISLPMKGVEDTVWARYQSSVAYVKQLPGYELCDIIPPIDITDFMPNYKPENIKYSYGYYLGKDVELLCDCTDILMSENWENSKGCKIEKYIAETLDINVIYKK
jgi:hypothetical protein